MRALDFLRDHPVCCFCGGTEAAVTIDHQPPKILFPKKHRPKGLEFPACKVCQEQTRGDEPVVSLIARATGGHRYKEGVKDWATTNAIKAIQRSFSGLLEAVSRSHWREQNGLFRPAVAIDFGHPQITKSMCLVAAKLALAAYYEHHKSSAPARVKINTMAVHNQTQGAYQSVHSVLSGMPCNFFLQQGARWNNQNTFFIRYFGEDASFMTAAILHESLALMAHITPTENIADWMPWQHVWVPVPGKGLQAYAASAAA